MTAREIPADELHQAVELLRSVVDVADAARERNQWEHWNEPQQLVHPQALRDLLAEFDRRGAELERSHRREGQAGDLLDKRDDDVRNLQTHLAEAVRERDAARAEVQQLRFVAERQRAELVELRARDEKAAAVVQWWVEGDGAGDRDELTQLLDALARAHETGGTDR